ncbi:hypothetical protein L2Q67_004728 [Salmonella enterica]|nr:hypothetical protein [Salmonella enterica]
MKTTLYLDDKLGERLDEDAARYKITRNKLIMMIIASHYNGAEAKAFFDAMNLLSPTPSCPETQKNPGIYPAGEGFSPTGEW